MSKELPDVASWKPRITPTENLKAAFFTRCRQVERTILRRRDDEKETVEYSFHSGSGVEDVIRDELRAILPKRYAADGGSICDRNGYSAGDCDVVIFNDTWFPLVKAPVTESSRRKIFPIEGVYAVLEVKQTLDPNVLDRAMEKLVVAHRLFRPEAASDRIAENRETGTCKHFISNPLYSAIVATGVEAHSSFLKLAERFIAINRQLPRRDVVRALCVLGEGTLVWGVKEDGSRKIAESESSLRPALFMREDRYCELQPVILGGVSDDSALYQLMVAISAHLYRSILPPEDLCVHYGN
ncbi:MAG TPA: DUF6602 domain-containing protein, partial [Acidobacteriaceae bacterium]|nr:DUF6602 domain-containing protein [Acidobacteriaceae bacterium]